MLHLASIFHFFFACSLLSLTYLIISLLLSKADQNDSRYNEKHPNQVFAGQCLTIDEIEQNWGKDYTRSEQRCYHALIDICKSRVLKRDKCHTNQQHMVDTAGENPPKSRPIEPPFLPIQSPVVVSSVQHQSCSSLIELVIVSFVVRSDHHVEIDGHWVFHHDVIDKTHCDNTVEDGKWPCDTQSCWEISEQEIGEPDANCGQERVFNPGIVLVMILSGLIVLVLHFLFTRV